MTHLIFCFVTGLVIGVGYVVMFRLGRLTVMREFERDAEKASWMASKLEEERAKRQALEIALRNERRKHEDSDWWKDEGEAP